MFFYLKLLKMPKFQKPRPGPESSDLHEVDAAAAAGTGSDLDALMAAIKQTEQSVLTKIDSSVMAAEGNLHKKIDNLASDLRTEILNVRTEFKKIGGCGGHGCRPHHSQRQAFLHLPRLLGHRQEKESCLYRGERIASPVCGCEIRPAVSSYTEDYGPSG